MSNTEQKQYYWVDIESGVRYPCSKEYYDTMKRIWNSVRPKLTLPEGKKSLLVLSGTGGENHFLKGIYEAGIDPITSEKSSIGFIPLKAGWLQQNKEE